MAIAVASSDVGTTVPSATSALAGKYLTFALAEEEYGLPVLKVREIIKMLGITAVPHAPVHVKGVINLRGKVIPVVDLRVKFGFPPRDYDESTCIIVVEVALHASKVMMGVVVDAVSEVLTIQADEIDTTPEFGDHVDTSYINGVAKIKGRVKFLVDLDTVFRGGVGMF